MKVWPTVSGIGSPALSKNRVGLVVPAFRHVPSMRRPFVNTDALPLPMRSASSRCFLSPIAVKFTHMTTTFFGSTRSPSAASTCFPSRLTERFQVFEARE